MILEELAQICYRIRLIEANFKMPNHLNVEKELTAWAIENKAAQENDLAREIYCRLKNYALGVNENDR